MAALPARAGSRGVTGRVSGRQKCWPGAAVSGDTVAAGAGVGGGPDREGSGRDRGGVAAAVSSRQVSEHHPRPYLCRFLEAEVREAVFQGHVVGCCETGLRSELIFKCVIAHQAEKWRLCDRRQMWSRASTIITL